MDLRCRYPFFIGVGLIVRTLIVTSLEHWEGIASLPVHFEDEGEIDEVYFIAQDLRANFLGLGLCPLGNTGGHNPNRVTCHGLGYSDETGKMHLGGFDPTTYWLLGIRFNRSVIKDTCNLFEALLPTKLASPD